MKLFKALNHAIHAWNSPLVGSKNEMKKNNIATLNTEN